MVLLNWLTLIHFCYYRDKGTDLGYKGSGQDGGEEEGEGGDGRGDLQRVRQWSPHGARPERGH